MLEEYLKEPKCFRNKDNKIFWRWEEQRPTIISNAEEWNEILDYCNANLKKMNPMSFQFKLGSHQWNDNCYFITTSKTSKFISIFVTYDWKIAVFITNQTYLNSEDSTAIEAEYDAMLREQGKKGVGSNSYEVINNMFQEIYQVKSTIYDLFSGSEYAKEFNEIKKCVPKQISYITSVTGREISGVYKADVSSAFPYQLTKTVPTLHGCKVLFGTYSPSEEYPFAFYTKSHHLAIYNELDTSDDVATFYMNNMLANYDTVEYCDEKTILCKASKYNFKEIVDILYKQKKSKNKKLSERAKLTLNGFIGFCQFNKHPRLSMISAVVIARSNHYILDKVKMLEAEKNQILYIATDSIVWRGNPSKVATDRKSLGAFVYELKDGSFFGRAVGSYQLKKNDKVLTKCSYISNAHKEDIKFGELPEPKHSKVIVDPNGKIYEV